MSALINLAAKFSGLGWIFSKLDGAKTYIAASVSILSGLAGLLQEFLAVEGKHDFSALLTFAKDLPQDSCWLLILAGAAAIGLKHGQDKVQAQAYNIAAAQSPAPAVSVAPGAALAAPVASPAPAVIPPAGPATPPQP